MPAIAALEQIRMAYLRRSGVSALLVETTPLESRGDLATADAIRSGVSSRAWADLRELGFTLAELAAILGVSEKTIARKLHSRAVLAVAESDRTARVAQITAEAVRAFADVDKALGWLRAPNRVMGGQRPIDLIATEPGAGIVRKALGVIEYGGLA